MIDRVDWDREEVNSANYWSSPEYMEINAEYIQ